MKRDSDDDEEEDEEVEHQQEEDEDEEEDKDEEENKDEDDGKELQTIGQGEMENTTADNVDTGVDDEPIIQPEWCQQMS